MPILHHLGRDTRSVGFTKSVAAVFAAHSDLAVQLLESRNAPPASRVISAVVDGEQAVSAGDVKLSSRTSSGWDQCMECSESSLCTHSEHTSFA